MSTAEIAGPRTFEGRWQRSAAVRESRAGPALLVGLLALLVYAAFDHGAGGLSAGARLQVAVSALAAAAAAGWVWTGALRVRAPRTAIAAFAMLTGFALWSGITLAWSVAPDQTWTELNRAITYVLVFGLAVAAGASTARPLELLSWGAVTIVAAVALYALSQKLLPGLHLSGVDQTQLSPRLQQPFGYWNALGLFLVFGVPPGLAFASDRALAPRVRLGALVAVELMLLAIGLTYSRGAIVALVLALAVWVGLGGKRLRSLMWLAAVCLTTLPPLVFGLTFHDLTTVSVGQGTRERAGLELIAVTVASLVALWLGASELIQLERSVRIGHRRADRIGRRLGAIAGTVLVCGLIAFVATGAASSAWHSFKNTHTTSNYDPRRLLSADSENRWVWWKEAAGAFSDRPLTGWGAGSFPVVHLLYRRDTTSVKQPHSVPLQFLAETGLLGGVLGVGAYALLIATGVGTTRRRSGSERVLAAALLAGIAAYGVHALYDWDWDIPGVTLPALVFAGVLAGIWSRSDESDGPRRTPGPAARVLAVGAITALLAAVAVSGVVPSVASSRASSALVGASNSSSAALAQAQSRALSAARLDPLSDAGLVAAATIAVHRGEIAQPRTYLLEAVQRNPEDVQAWRLLEQFELGVGDIRAAFAATQRVAELDPTGIAKLRFVAEASLFLSPPAASATSVRTP